MQVAVFSTKMYDRRFLSDAFEGAGHGLSFFEARLSLDTASLAQGHQAVCAFVNDRLDRTVLDRLAEAGVGLVAMRCAGYNHVDLDAAKKLHICVARVPAYSPHAVAEHTLALILTLNRKTHRAYNRVREGNFAIDGLLGFDLCSRTAGVVGTGTIGSIVARLFAGFGCRVLAHDVKPDPACQGRGVTYADLDTVMAHSDILSLHCPLTPQTHHLIDAQAVSKFRHGMMLVNTSRGALVDTPAVIDGLKAGRVGSFALDVYEEEADFFFEDHSATVIQDDTLARLLTFPNVLVTSHQAFFTHEAMENIAQTTRANVDGFERGHIEPANQVER
ncbi:MAG: 2-hydroxyacid dehydrogenase [Planctomycetota bacterium]